MFLQIHTLTSYHAGLLNRDDAGLAKRIPFGDAVRMRISSQCLKRHWRESLKDTLHLPQGIRSRHFFEREVLPRVISSGVEQDLAQQLVRRLLEKLISGGLNDGPSLVLKQPILFGKPEADFFVKAVCSCAKEPDPANALDQSLKAEKGNYRALLNAAGYGNLFAGVEGALFGRFVTSDILARSDASVHVAHAFTVHALDTEVDYFTVVDDLNREEETGAAHANDMELGAGLFYSYIVLDIPLLISNLSGCHRTSWREQDSSDARDIIQNLVRVIATVSPGAKLGSTAPYAYSDLVLLETGVMQPRSLANAFLTALPVKGNLMQGAADALCGHIESVDAMYGATVENRVASSTQEIPRDVADTMPLDKAIQETLTAVFGG